MKKILFPVLAVLFAACNSAEITQETSVTLTNKAGNTAVITNFGARIMAINVPDRDGNKVNVQVGFATPQEYHPENGKNVYGALIGRYANRIGKAAFTLDGKEYRLEANNQGNCLHGAGLGWQNSLFTIVSHNDRQVKLKYVSPDGEQDFPGEVTLYVTYTWGDDNDLRIDYEAQTDAPTVINVTNHSFFNLAGGDSGYDTLDEIVSINADSFTACDSTKLAVEVRGVEGTPMDFRTGKTLRQDINSEYDQVAIAGTFDHNFILNTAGDLTKLAACMICQRSGIVMSVYTTEPGVQLYLPRNDEGAGKAVCLETQHFPDSPNHPEWPTTVLRPGEKFQSTTIYTFSNAVCLP